MFSRLHEGMRRLDVRLTIYYTALLLTLTGVVIGFMYFRMERTLIKQVDRLLNDEMLELIRQGENTGADFAHVCEAYARDISRRQFYPVYFRVRTAGGTVYFQNFDAAEIPLSPADAGQPSFFTVGVFEKPAYFRVHQHDLTLLDGSQYLIEMATPLKFLKDVLNNYMQNVLILLPIVLILGATCGILVSRKPRAVIKNIVATTSSINAQNLRQRLPVSTAGGGETQDLITAINAMMDRLEKAFAEIKYFTADVSHELRNPLFSLKGAIEVALTEQRTGEEYHRVLNDCIEQVNALIKMVNDLFLISRFELKNIDLELSDLNLSEMLDDLYDFFLPLAEEKKIHCSMERSDMLPVKADKTKIYQLMSNLIENGIKFTPEGGSVKMELSTDHGEVTFMVSDNGPGIPEADMPYIFNRFYQVDKSRSASAQRGSGLGLHICKKIVEAHGGIITVASNATGGVAFTVKLPLR
jgi:heavy metal sensor kinase